MIQKLVGLITALSITVSGLIAIDTPTKAYATDTSSFADEAKVYDESSIIKDSLSELKLVVTPDSENPSINFVQLESNVNSVPSDFPITISDANSYEILKTCSVIAECSFTLDSSLHSAIYAQGKDVISEVYSFNNSEDSSSQSLENSSLSNEQEEPKDFPEQRINSSNTAPKEVEIQNFTTTNWGVDLTIDNPQFNAGETFNLTTTINQNLTGSSYSVYIFDITNDSLITSYNQGYEYWAWDLKFLQGDTSRQYKSYIADSMSNPPASQSELTNIQATSGVVTAYRAPWEVTMVGTNTTFPSKGQHYGYEENPDAEIQINQNLHYSPYQSFIVDTATNKIYSSGISSFNPYFKSGSAKTFRTYIALKNDSATTLDELEDIQAYSNALTFTRKPWIINATSSISSNVFPVRNSPWSEPTDPNISFDFGQQLYASYTDYNFFVVETGTGDIVDSFNYNSSATGHGFSGYWTGGQKTKTFKGYIALRTNPNTNEAPRTLSELVDIQGSSPSISFTRKDWALSIGWNAPYDQYNIDQYRYNLTPEIDQTIYWSGYRYLTHDITANTWTQSQYPGGTGYIPINKSHFVRAYVGTPIYAPGTRRVTGVTDIQKASNTVLISYQNGMNADGTPSEMLQGGSNPSTDCAQACAGDPINTLTGEFWEQNNDVSLPNVGVPLQFVRAYNTFSSTENESQMGNGWTNNYSMKISDAAETNNSLWEVDSLNIRQENNSLVTFHKAPSGEYLASAEVLASLTYSSASDTFTFKRNSGASFEFDAVTGRLLKQKDSFGNALLISYDNQGRLQKITADTQNFIELTYSSNLISKVEDSSGYFVEYEYDINKNLTKVTDNQGIIKQYNYNSDKKITEITDALGGTTHNEYDSQNRVTKQTDPNGNALNFVYNVFANENASGHNFFQTTITNPDGSKEFQQYNYAGRLTYQTKAYDTPQALNWYYEYDTRVGKMSKKVNPDGSQQLWSYDSQGNLLQEVDASGIRVTTYSNYTPQGAPQFIKDALNNETKIIYTQEGAIASVEDAEGNISTVTTNSNGTSAKTTSALGYETQYVYDTDNNVSKVTNAAGNETIFTYDSAGNVTSKTDALNKTTEYEYDSRGNLLSTTDPNGNTTSVQYDNASRIISQTNPLNQTKTISYDANSNVLSTTDNANNTTSFTYDSMNRVITSTDSLGSVTEYEYDVLGNTVLTRDALNNETKYEYDALGNVIKTTTPEGAELVNVYDSTGRLTTSYDAAGNATNYTYDNTNAGNVLTITDALNKTNSFTYDKLGNVIKAILPDGTIETAEYDADSRKTSFIDSGNKLSTYTYDNLNNLISSNIYGFTNQYEYDAVNSLVKKTQQDGSYINYSYNNLHNLDQISYSDNTPSVSYTYDNLGRQTSMNDGSGTTTFVYDDLSRLISTTKNSQTTSYAYDAMQRTKITYPSGEEVNYTYDSLHRLTNVNSSSLSSPISYSYNKDSQLSSTDYGNGIVQNISYANNLMVNKIDYVKSSTSILKYDYGYNETNLMITKSISRQGAIQSDDTYDFDNRNRLSSKNTVPTFVFDSSNNLVSRTNGDVITYNSMSQATSLDNSVDGKNFDFAYDARGNRTKNTENAISSSTENDYIYNVANQLVEAKLGANPPPGNEKTIQYSYDGNGLLSQKIQQSNSSSSISENYVWDSNTDIAKLLEDDSHIYIYGNGLAPLAQVNKNSDAVEYFHGDSTENIGLVTDETGTSVAEYNYDEYGNTVSGETSHATTRFGYAGQYLDTDTGMYLMRARWYDPKTAQFLTVDPKLITTNSPYAYVLGNPLQYSDPLGLDIFSDFYSANHAFIDNLANYSSGLGNNLSFGLSKNVQDFGDDVFDTLYGRKSNDVVHECSAFYKWGYQSGYVITAASGLGLGLKIVPKLIIKHQAKAAAKQAATKQTAVKQQLATNRANGKAYEDLVQQKMYPNASTQSTYNTSLGKRRVDLDDSANSGQIVEVKNVNKLTLGSYKKQLDKDIELVKDSNHPLITEAVWVHHPRTIVSNRFKEYADQNKITLIPGP